MQLTTSCSFLFLSVVRGISFNMCRGGEHYNLPQAYVSCVLANLHRRKSGDFAFKPHYPGTVLLNPLKREACVGRTFPEARASSQAGRAPGGRPRDPVSAPSEPAMVRRPSQAAGYPASGVVDSSQGPPGNAASIFCAPVPSRSLREGARSLLQPRRTSTGLLLQVRFFPEAFAIHRPRRNTVPS